MADRRRRPGRRPRVSVLVAEGRRMRDFLSMRHHGREWPRALFLAAAVLVVLIPLVWTALAAIGIQPDNNSSPPSWIVRPTIDHVAEVSVVEPAFWQELATSVGVSAIAAVLAAAISFLAAFGLARPCGRSVLSLSPPLLSVAILPAIEYVLPSRHVLRRR